MIYMVMLIVCYVLINCFKENVALQVHMKNIRTTLSSNNTILACSYTLDQDEILTVGLLGYNTTTKAFEQIAGYRPNKVAKLLTHGEYLHDRVTLNNITNLSTQAFILFNEVRCIDAILYKCTITYLNKVLKLLTVESSEVNITITVPPTKPESIYLKETAASLTERNNATFICKGNVGNPPGKFIWHTKRREDVVSDVYTHGKTNHTKIEESCSYIRMAALTITLTETDNQAVVGCAEESLMNNETMFKYTPPINVFFKVRVPIIMKYPNQSTYPEGSAIILLTCISNGNPLPTYSWYFNRTLINVGSVLEIKDGRESESGSYICDASNAFHGTIFEASKSVYIQITISVIVAVTCGLLAVIVIFLVTWIFHRLKLKSINKISSSTDKNNKEMNTYYTIDDTSYERIGPLEHHQYQEIFQISSTEDCNDNNTQYLTAVSIEDENQQESIITLPKN